MKIYTCYSDSHEVLYRDYFLPSIKPHGWTIDATRVPQLGDGNWSGPGWKNAVGTKLAIFRRAMDECCGGYWIWSDVDIQYFSDPVPHLLHELGHYDIATQAEFPAPNEKRECCTGLMIVMANDRTKQLFDTIEHNYGFFAEDQQVFNHYRNLCAWKTLSPRFWCKNLSAEPPVDIVSQHANWMIGVDAKVKALQHIRQLNISQSKATIVYTN